MVVDSIFKLIQKDWRVFFFILIHFKKVDNATKGRKKGGGYIQKKIFGNQVRKKGTCNLGVVTAKDLLTSISRLVDWTVGLVLASSDTKDLCIRLGQLDKRIIACHLGSDRSSQIVLSTTIVL